MAGPLTIVGPLYSDYFHPQKIKKERTGTQNDFYLILHLQSARRLKYVAQPLRMYGGPTDHLQSQGVHRNC